MAEPKTKPTAKSVTAFLNSVADPARRADCFEVLRMMQDVTGEKAKMWGPAIVGFGTFHYQYASGRQGDWPIAAFSPRKTDLTLYLTPEILASSELMQKLGRFKTGKSCLYLKKLEDVDQRVLKRLIRQSVQKISKYRVKTP